MTLNSPLLLSSFLFALSAALAALSILKHTDFYEDSLSKSNPLIDAAAFSLAGIGFLLDAFQYNFLCWIALAIAFLAVGLNGVYHNKYKTEKLMFTLNLGWLAIGFLAFYIVAEELFKRGA